MRTVSQLFFLVFLTSALGVVGCGSSLLPDGLLGQRPSITPALPVAGDELPLAPTGDGHFVRQVAAWPNQAAAEEPPMVEYSGISN